MGITAINIIRNKLKNNIIDSYIKSMFKKLTNKITIDVGPELFTFYCNNSILQVSPYVHIINTENGFKVIDAGKDIDIPNAIKVNIFYDYHSSRGSLKSKDIMAALLRYGIRNVVKSKSAMIRPHICFKNAGKLKIICEGKQEALLREIACEAGAWEVFFE